MQNYLIFAATYLIGVDLVRACTSVLLYVLYKNNNRLMWLNASSRRIRETDFHLDIDVFANHLWHVGEELIIVGYDKSKTLKILFYNLRTRTSWTTTYFFPSKGTVDAYDDIHFFKIRTTLYCYFGSEGKLLEVVPNDENQAPPGETRNISRHFSSVSNIHGQPCLIGGLINITQPVTQLPLLCYNMQSRNWEDNDTFLIHPVISPGSIVHGGKLYVCGGGQEQYHKLLRSCSIYDISNGTLTSVMYVSRPNMMSSWYYTLATIGDIPYAVGLDEEYVLVKRALDSSGTVTVADLQIGRFLGAFTSCDQLTDISRTLPCKKSVTDATLNTRRQDQNSTIYLTIIGILTVCVIILSGVTGRLFILNRQSKRKSVHSSDLQQSIIISPNMTHPSISIEESEATVTNKQMSATSTTKHNSQSVTVTSSGPKVMSLQMDSSRHDVAALLGQGNIITKVKGAFPAVRLKSSENVTNCTKDTGTHSTGHIL